MMHEQPSLIVDNYRRRSVKCLATSDNVEGRRVLEVAYNGGSYGMGGCGFFGLQLENQGRRRTEWLVCTLWAADHWMVVNGRWLAAHCPVCLSE